ncbi:MAG: SPOR domain-containing protein [Deltaproteobacteria bacterium]|nr:MAG: SPOR domain-containing protein [Deltaproteobacteria bacterium]
MAEPNNKKPSGGLIPKRNAGWLLFLVFVSGWMFFLGVLVGRGTAPVRFDIDKLQKKLAALKEADIKEQLSRVKIDSETTKMQKDFGFYEALKDTKGEGGKYTSRKSDTPSSQKVPSSEKAGSETKKKSSHSNIHQTKTVPKAKIEDGIESGEAEKTLTIQAASFKDPKDAEQMVAKLKKKGYPAYKIIGIVPKKGVWYRVRIGHYGNSDEAAATLKRLEKDGFKPYLITQ